MMRREVPGVLAARYRSPQCRGGRAISAAGTGMCRVARQVGVAGASSVTSDAAACGADAVRQQAFRERCGARRVARPVAVAGASSVTRDAATCGADAVRRQAFRERCGARRVVLQEAVAGGASSVTRDAATCGVDAVRREVVVVASWVTSEAASCGVDAVRRGVQAAVAGASSCGAGAVRRRALGDSVAGVTLVTRWGTGLVWALGPVPGAELTR